MLWRSRVLRILLSAGLLLLVALLLGRPTALWFLTGTDALPESIGMETQALRSDPLGLVLIDIKSEETARRYHVSRLGVYVLAVQENSAAQTAGILSGDQILSFDGVTVASSVDISQPASLEGRSIECLVFRDGEERRFFMSLTKTSD